MWDDIVEMLKREEIVPVFDTPTSRKTLETIKVLYEYYGVIIPVEYTPDRSLEFDSSIITDKLHCQYYILPALLENLENSSIKMPASHYPAFSKFQRVYEFYSFIPPGLIQKLVARVYFENNIKPDENKIWKNAFSQMILNSKSENGKCALAYMTAFLDSDAAVKKLILTVYGSCMDYSDLLKNLDRYCTIVTSILDNYCGFSAFLLLAPCPFCDLRTSRTDGEFVLSFDHYRRRFILENDRTDQSPISHCIKGCVVPKNMLIAGHSLYMPTPVLELRNRYLEDEICRDSRIFSLPNFSRMTCRIAMGVYHDIFPDVKLFSAGSGCFVDSDMKKFPVVFTCEHTYESLSSIYTRTRMHVKQEMPNIHRVVLIGNNTHYIYSAEIIFKGNSTPRLLCSDTKNEVPNIQDRRHTALYDVIVLGNIKHLQQCIPIASLYEISPQSLNLATRKDIRKRFDIIDLTNYKSSCVELDSKIVSLGYPQSYLSGVNSLNIDRGRVIQVSSRDEFFARVYNDKGGSGGPALNAYTKELMGIMHGETRTGSNVMVYFTPQRALTAIRTMPDEAFLPTYSFIEDIENRRIHESFKSWYYTAHSEQEAPISFDPSVY